MSLFKYLAVLVIALGLSIGPGIDLAYAETVEERNKRIQGIFNEYRAMQFAIMVHRKCNTIDKLTLKAAETTSDLRTRKLLEIRAIDQPQLNKARAAIQKELDGVSCGQVKANANLILANNRATFYKDFYLLIWYEYMEVAALRIMLQKGDIAGNKAKFQCGQYSFDQIRAIKPYTDAAYNAMKGRGQYKNSQAQAKDLIEKCQNKTPGVETSPLMQMMDVAQAELAKG
ncbi:MAG: hypothetical protein Pars2KO_00890 [Parasphingorhabdus sp.]